MSATLASSQNDEDVVAALSVATWWKLERDGDPEIPSLEELGEWWRSACPKEVRLQAEDRHRRLMDWCDDGNREPPREQLLLTFGSREAEPDLPTLLDPGRPYEITQKWNDANQHGFNGPHPLGVLLMTWHGRRVPILANTRDDPVFASLGLTPQEERSVAAWAAMKQVQAGPVLSLANMGPGERNGPPDSTPSYPLLLWELASRRLPTERSWARWLAARIFVDVMLDVGPEHWALSASHGVRLPAQRFRDFLTRVYTPNRWGRISWTPSKQLDTMLAAFELLEAPDMRIPWYDSEHEVGGQRRVLVPLDVPRTGHADDVVQFAIHLPPGISEGTLVDRPLLRLAGAKSMPAWRLWLNLSDYWRRPGRTRFPGKGGTTWVQARKATRYPVVSNAQLVAWAYPQADPGLIPSAQRKRWERVRQELAWLRQVKAINIVNQGGRRILPGPKWAGWSGGPR